MNIFFIATKKVGMTQIVTSSGEVLPITLLSLLPHNLFDVKVKKVHGYNAIRFSAGDEKKTKHTKKPMLAQYAAKNLPPREKIFEVRLDSDAENFSVEGEAVDYSFLDSMLNTKVDAQGISIGKGFAGAMKRWNFRGLEATHGVSITHRSHGSTGQRQDPGKVFKGKKMAGHLGQDVVTTQNLELVLIDKELGLVGVKGSIPGAKSGLVFLKNAVKFSDALTPQNVNGLKVIYS